MASLLERWFPPAKVEQRSAPVRDNIASSLFSWFGGAGSESDAGEAVNDHTAMKQSTVYACIRVLSESTASLPLHLMKSSDKGSTHEVNHPLQRLLSVAPNPEMTAFTWVETLVTCLNLTGNAYCQIERNSVGVPVGLWPLHPRQTHAVRLPNGDLAFETSDGGQRRVLRAADVLHIPLNSMDGIVGLSPIQQAARTIGVSIASEKYGARLFRQGSVPLLALTSPEKVRPEHKVAMRHDWEALQTGDNQHRVAILDNGLTIQKLGITPEEAQFLETRAYQRADIAAIFRVPASYVGEQQKISNSNMQQESRNFYNATIRALTSRLEAEFNRKLFAPESGLFCRFNLADRLRGDYEQVAQAVTTMRQWSIASINESRELLGLSRLSSDLLGNSLLFPVNMTAVNAVTGATLIEAQQPQQVQQGQQAQPEKGDTADE